MLKNLKSLFIVEESQQELDKATSKVSQDQNNSVKSAKSTTVQANGVVDSQIIGKLLEAVEKNNLEGFDYLEYKKALKALDKMPMDEPTKYRSAFATAATLGVTLDKLVETTRFYLDILDKENRQFGAAFKSQFADKVSGKEKEVAQFEAIILEKSDKIKQLTEEIAKHQQQISELKIKIEEDKLKIDKTQEDFKHSFDHLKSQFERDIEKMQQYLK